MILFIGCSSKSTEPLEPISNSFKFEKITLDFEQNHFPKTKTYQSKEDIEKKLNNEILKNLKLNNKYNEKETDELVIEINFRRIFIGEDLPFESMKSDTIGSPKLGYDIKIVNKGKVLRSLVRTNLIFDPGFFGNLKTIAMMNTDDVHENSAIEALGKDIAEQVKEFK